MCPPASPVRAMWRYVEGLARVAAASSGTARHGRRRVRCRALPRLYRLRLPPRPPDRIMGSLNRNPGCPCPLTSRDRIRRPAAAVAWTRGKKLRFTWGATSAQSSAGRGGKACRSTGNTTTSWALSTPFNTRSMRGEQRAHSDWKSYQTTRLPESIRADDNGSPRSRLSLPL